MLLFEGLAAYRDLEYAAAAQLLRRALAPEARPPLAAADRYRALMYLGASELLGGDRGRAVDSFRALLLDNPRFRPDSLVFPPRVTQVVNEVAQTTKAVAVTTPQNRAFVAGERAFTVQVHATSPHLVRVTLGRPGAGSRTLYDGAITDSVVMVWDGLDGNGAPVRAGSYVLEVASMVAEGSVLRSVRVPLDVRVEAPDTLPWPPQPAGARGADMRFLIPGLVLGAALALPAIVGDVSGESTRIALGVTIFGIGAVASLRRSDSREREAWSREVEPVRQENARRGARPRLVVRSGAPQRVEGSG